MKLILGPCRCQGCHQWVWWATGRTRSVLVGRTADGGGAIIEVTRWRDSDGRRHQCPGRAA